MKLLAASLAVLLVCPGAHSAGTMTRDWRWFLAEAELISRQGNMSAASIRDAQDSAVALAATALGLLRAENPGADSSAVILGRMGEYFLQASRFPQAESVWNEALALLKPGLPSCRDEYDETLIRLAVLHADVGLSLTLPEVLAEVTGIDSTIQTADSRRSTGLLWKRALLFAHLSRVDEFHVDLERLVDVAHKTTIVDPRLLVRALIYLAEGQSKGAVSNVGKSSEGQDSALHLAETALLIAGREFDPVDTMLAIVLNRLGDYHARLGNSNAAVEAWERAWRINSATLPHEHAEYQATIFRMASVFRVRGDYQQAARLYTEAIELSIRTYGPSHPETAFRFMGLGTIHRLSGDFAAAETCLVRALAIRQSAIEHIDADIAETYMGLGRVYYDQGRYPSAEECFARALDLRRNASITNPALIADCMSALGNMYQTWGRLDDAREMFAEALAAQEKFLGATHPDLAGTLRSLASVAIMSGAPEQAEKLLERALSLLSESGGLIQSSLASCQIELARAYRAQGRLVDSKELLHLGLETIEQVYGRGDFRLLPIIVEAATVSFLCGDSNHGDSLLGYAARIDSLDCPLGHPYSAAVCDLMSDRRRHAGELASAREYAARSFQINHAVLREGASVMAERDALSAAWAFSRSRDRLLSLLLDNDQQDPDDARLIAEIALASKSQVSDEIFRRAAALRETNQLTPEPLADSLRFARARLASLYVRQPGRGAGKPGREDAANVQEEILRLERAIARNVSARSGTVRVPAAGQLLVEVLHALPDGAVLIEYVRYQDPPAFGQSAEPHYMALWMRSTGEVGAVDLGPADQIDDLVMQYRDHLQVVAHGDSPPDDSLFANYLRISEALARQVWSPLGAAVDSAKMYLIAPDASLNLISFAGLPNPARPDRFLIDNGAFHYLSAARDLLRDTSRSRVADGLLAVGDPDFTAPHFKRRGGAPVFFAVASATSPSPLRQGELRATCEALSEVILSPLPGTQREVQMLSDEWSRAQAGPVTILTGESASEENLKSEAGHQAVIHIATHGFFAPGDCRPWSDSHSADQPTEPVTGENPLLASGLCLAGAGLHGEDSDEPGAEDGFLTAMEVASLKLEGTQWVVLSACESGLGQSVSGEGVYGLRRAFLEAGARTVISSLWELPDGRTAEFMRSVYRRSDRPAPLALHAAALERLEDLRRRRQPPHPYLWAPFVSVGDWQSHP